MSERYRIPKFKVRVEIRTLRGSSEEVSIFLSQRAESHAGPERPLDMLNGDAEFIVVELASGEVGFLRRSSLSVVTMPVGETCDALAEPEPLAADLFDEAMLRLVLEDGSELEGLTRYELPEQSCRVQDFFNGSELFVTLIHDGRVSFVNKGCIARVLPR